MADNKKPAPAATADSKKSNKSPRERFLSVGAARVGKAIKALRNIKPIASKKSYEYNDTEISKALNALRTELAAVEQAFEAAKHAGTGATKEAGFAFS